MLSVRKPALLAHFRENFPHAASYVNLFAFTELFLGRSYGRCSCVNSTLMFGMSISMSLAGAKASATPGCPFSEFLGYGISLSPLYIQDNTVLLSEHRREFEPQTARQIMFTAGLSLNDAALSPE
jgi:hypothetical protein